MATDPDGDRFVIDSEGLIATQLFHVISRGQVVHGRNKRNRSGREIAGIALKLGPDRRPGHDSGRGFRKAGYPALALGRSETSPAGCAVVLASEIRSDCADSVVAGIVLPRSRDSG